MNNAIEHDPFVNQRDNQPIESGKGMSDSFGRTKYWKHITFSWAMPLILWPFLFALDVLPEDFLTDWGGAVGVAGIAYLVAMIVYLWRTVLRRVKDARRSAFPWVVGVLIPYINFIVLIRLGLIQAPDDRSKLTTDEKILTSFWIAGFTAVYWSVFLTKSVLNYVVANSAS